MSFQDLTFPTRTQDGVPRDSQRDKKENAWQVEKSQRPFNVFYEVASGPHFFPPGSRKGPQGTTEGTKRKTHDRYENPIDFLLSFMKSYQNLPFSTRIQDGTPRGNQSDKKGQCLADIKTLKLFYWILWDPFRTSLFPTRAQDGITGDNQRNEKPNVWQIENA